MEQENLLVKIERADAEIKMIRELLSQKDERITHIAEEIGESRSMIIRKDQDINKITTELDKLQSMVQDLDPVEISKTLAKKDQSIMESQMKIEMIETTLGDIKERIKGMQGTVEKIEGFESAIKIHKEVDDIYTKIKENSDTNLRISERVETTFFELDKRLREFDKTQAKMEMAEDISKELVKTVDKISIRLDNTPNREDINSAKDTFKTEAGELKSAFNRDKMKAESDITNLNRGVMEIQSKLKEIDSFKIGVNSSISELTRKQEAKDIQLQEVMGSLDTLSEKTIEMDSSLKSVQTNQAKNMVSIEENINSIRGRLDGINKKDMGIESSINEIKLYNSNQREQIENLRGNIESLKTSISMNEANSEHLEHSFEVLSSRVDTIKTNADNEMKNAFSERKKFIDQVGTVVSNMVKTNEETNDMISNFNRHVSDITAHLANLSMIFDNTEDKTLDKLGIDKKEITNLRRELGDAVEDLKDLKKIS